MKYIIKKSYVDVVGVIWMPPITAATRYDLNDYHIRNMMEGEESCTREVVEQWLATNSGDFQSITDFSASIEMEDNSTVNIPWNNEESECTFLDCMFPSED